MLTSCVTGSNLAQIKQQVKRHNYYWYKSCWAAARRGILTSASINTGKPVREDYYGLEEEQESKSTIEKISFLPTSSDKQPTEFDRVIKVIESSPSIDVDQNIDQNPQNEFQTPCIALMFFPFLFPDCARDATNNSTVSSIN